MKKLKTYFSFCLNVSDMIIPKFLSKPLWRPFETETQLVRIRNTRTEICPGTMSFP